MRAGTLLALALAAGLEAAAEPPRLVNYDEAKVGSAVPEDPLVADNGRRIATAAEWPARRREILALLEREEYGAWPPKPETLVVDETAGGSAFLGTARRRQFSQYFRADRSGPRIDWMLLEPTGAKGPFPVVVILNYRGNQELLPDGDIPVMDAWVPARCVPKDAKLPNRMDARSRGFMRWPLDIVLARGYAVLTACYQQIATDAETKEMSVAEMRRNGCYRLWPKDQDTGALIAWGWGLSRGLDLAERVESLDATQAVAYGYSRLGKAALLAAAFDERFKVSVPCQTGGGGVPLQKHNFGENAYWMTRVFPHWFGKGYFKYDGNEQAMPFDQHFVLAAIAPRHVLVQSFDEDWYDPKGEYLACRAASPVWEFLGRPGLPAGEYPETLSTARIGTHLGYVRRHGTHGISGYDWIWMLDFADRALGRTGSTFEHGGTKPRRKAGDQ